MPKIRYNTAENHVEKRGHFKFGKGLLTGLLLSASVFGGYKLVNHYVNARSNTPTQSVNLIADNTQEYDDLKDYILILENENESLKGENESLKDENESLKEQLAEANALIAQLKEQINKLNASIDKLSSDFAALEDKAKSLTEENKSLKAEVESLKSSLSESINYYKELSAMYDELKNAPAAKGEDVEKLKADLAAAYNKIAGYESKIVALYTGLTKSDSTPEEALEALESLLKLFGINYSDQDASSYSSTTEYEP